MELIKPIQSIVTMFDRMKKNNQQCPHVEQRIRALEKLVIFISEREPGKLSEDVSGALGILTEVLSSAAKLISKFNEAFKVTQIVKSGDYKSEFDNLNKSLTDAFVTLSAALHVLQGRKLEKQEERLAEQEDQLDEQKKRLAEQRRKMAEQQDQLAELDGALQRVESQLHDGRRGYYCVLQ